MKLHENINDIYNKLLETYSYQGWWPLINYKDINHDKTEFIKYHPKDYNFPKNNKEQFEIIIGSILTQNTTWSSVERALINLSKLMDFSAENLLKLSNNEKEFKDAIRCAGFVNQKLEYLQNISKFYMYLDGKTPSRDDLMKIKGIGNETADSILLFAYKEKEFKVDNYTKRIFSYLGYIKEKDNYLTLKKLFEDNFKGNVCMFQEYHALIVEHAKRYYTKKPYCMNDKLLEKFKV